MTAHIAGHLRIPDEYAGQKGQCAGCRERFLVPTKATGLGTSAGAAPESSSHLLRRLETMDIDPSKKLPLSVREMNASSGHELTSEAGNTALLLIVLSIFVALFGWILLPGIHLIIAWVFGIWGCFLYARTKGRGWAWALCGLVPIFGPGLLFLVPAKTASAEVYRAAALDLDLSAGLDGSKIAEAGGCAPALVGFLIGGILAAIVTTICPVTPRGSLGHLVQWLFTTLVFGSAITKKRREGKDSLWPWQIHDICICC